MLEYGGQDATEDFFGLHRTEVLEKYEKRLLIGKVAGSQPVSIPGFGELSKVPFAEPNFWRGFHSGYYNDSHHQYRLAIRKLIAAEIRETAEEYERSSEQVPMAFKAKLGKLGLYAALMGVRLLLHSLPAMLHFSRLLL